MGLRREGHVHDGVPVPALIVEMPPLRGIDREPLGLHGGTQHVSVASRQWRAPRIVWVGARRHLVEAGGHLHLGAGPDVEEGHVHGAPPVVDRSLRGVGHELALVGRCGVPEGAGDRPRAVGVPDDEDVAFGLQGGVGPREGHGRFPVQEGLRPCRVHGPAHEIVFPGVFQIHADGGIHGLQGDEIGLPRRRRVHRENLCREGQSKGGEDGGTPPPDLEIHGLLRTSDSQPAQGLDDLGDDVGQVRMAPFEMGHLLG